MLSIMVFAPYINLDFKTFNCYYIINSNYSEPLRTMEKHEYRAVLRMCVGWFYIVTVNRNTK